MFPWPQHIDLKNLFNSNGPHELYNSMKSLYRSSVDRKYQSKDRVQQSIKELTSFMDKFKSSYQEIRAKPYLMYDQTKYLNQCKQTSTSTPVSNLSGGQTTKKKVLILISDTGGGHRASAQAIDQALSKAHSGQVDVSILDIWTDYAKWPFNRFVPTYRFLARNPILWKGFYAYGAFPPTKLFTEICSKISSYQSFKRAIIQRNPDIVVSMHPLCQLMPLSIVAEINKKKSPGTSKVPFVTIVTDLGKCRWCYLWQELSQTQILHL
jgi:hypothetical protein